MGFRPFVYRLALRHGITGWVRNSSDGVAMEVEGAGGALTRFLGELRSELPPLARIDGLASVDLPVCGDREFTIVASAPAAGRFSLVPPDIATCPECLAEMRSPDDRRFGYPFTNCTNCGPRYTVIRDVPYDRPNTTMSVFPLCERCRAEYENPLDRRFHAEPIACPACGPALDGSVKETRRWLHVGRIVAIKGLGGFHLACDAFNAAAVETLRERKRRSGKAFAVMAASMDVAEGLCVLDDASRALLSGTRKPIVIAERRPDCGLAAAVAPGSTRLGVMLPYTPLHSLLFDERLTALVMTSGNQSEEPIVSRNEEARRRLHALADHFLLHNRDIQTRVDDSVMQLFEGREYPVRRSRGYAPDPVDLGMPLTEVLACGGELKNTLCLTKDRYAILSQHIGDLENLETLEFFGETLGHLQRFFRVSPVAVAHDLHPGYMSTRYALQESGLPPIGVQHHHAHIASCMADNELDGPVIGVALDGTGYGTDGRIWGGEFLVCDYLGFERAGHLRYVPLAGGDHGVRQPWRSALAYLLSCFGEDAMRLDLPMFDAVPSQEVRIVRTMIERRFQTIDTSSCGRLFDAVSSLLGIRHETTYEGQAAIELEMAAHGEGSAYPFRLDGADPFSVDVRLAVEAMVRDLLAGVDRGEIAANFHLTMARVVAAGCDRIREASGLQRVCLSGGAFQNLRLLRQTVGLLRGAGFAVFVHHRVPTNDGGLALGQAVIASRSLTRVPR